jgi:hypothetical protein
LRKVENLAFLVTGIFSAVHAGNFDQVDLAFNIDPERRDANPNARPNNIGGKL